MVYRCLYCVPTLIPSAKQFNRTHFRLSTSKNFGTKWCSASCHISNCNIFRGEQDATKVNNLTAAHWLNTLCRRGAWCLKRRNCYQRNVNVTHAVAYLHFHLPKFMDPENCPVNGQYLNPVDFSVWDALQQKLYRWKFRDIDYLIYLKCVLLNCWDQKSQDTLSAATDQLLNTDRGD